MYYVYVLLSEKDNKFYIGYTKNLEKRIQTHNKGLVPSTSFRQPLKLIFYEAHLYKKDALRREDYLKTSPGKKSLKFILREFLKDLKFT
ncbi:MAG: GIY-YIG nuclease family protein [Candidatus Margulisbacteria bacterium]|nr:GIY-YIG nuclease family protein [Candidatus Margulisiibacteriota bacterium]